MHLPIIFTLQRFQGLLFHVQTSYAKSFLWLSKTQGSPNSKLQVNAPSNTPRFAKACKESKSTCPSPICHNLVKSPFKYSEGAKFSVTVLPFKYYKLLRRMPFRITNKPLDILKTPLQESLSGPSLLKLQLRNVSHILQLSHCPTKQLWCELYISLQSNMRVHLWMTSSLHLFFQN